MSSIETELKLRLADPDSRDSLLSSPLLSELSLKPPRKQTIETTYYDATDQRLLKARLSYRLRLAGGQWTATIKADGTSDGGLHQRDEYNVVVDEPVPSIDPFLDTPIGPRLADALAGASLEPAFGTYFDRYILDVTTPDGSHIEFALDDGEISAGANRERLLEIELELKSGNPLALIRLGAELARNFPLLPEQNSKLYRAIRLTGNADPLIGDNPSPSPLKKNSATTPAHTALSQVIVYYIHQLIIAQQAFLTIPNQPETLHELRVALRRLRTLVSFAKPLLPAEEYVSWQHDLSAWGSTLGTVRDLDVLNMAWGDLTSYMETGIINTGKLALTALLTAKQAAVRTNLLSTITAGQATPLLLALWAWTQAWAENYTEEPVLLKDFAANRLASWIKNLLTQGNHLDLSDMNAVHELRIAGKKLRYTLDALAPILPANTERFSQRLKALQTLLGIIHDVSATPALLGIVVKPSSSRLLHHDTGIITGWQLARSATAGNKWQKLWTKTHKSALKLKIMTHL